MKLGQITLTLSDLDWADLASKGAQKVTQVATSRSYPGKGDAPWANSFKKAMTAGEYAEYVAKNDITNADLYKTTQTSVVADKGDTLAYILTWVFDTFANDANQEALIKWICDFFELKGGAAEAVRKGVNELFKQADAFGSSDIIVSALLTGLGMGVAVDAALTGNIAQIQQIFKDLFGAIGDSSTSTYGAIARAMEKLTGVLASVCSVCTNR